MNESNKIALFVPMSIMFFFFFIILQIIWNDENVQTQMFYVCESHYYCYQFYTFATKFLFFMCVYWCMCCKNGFKSRSLTNLFIFSFVFVYEIHFKCRLQVYNKKRITMKNMKETIVHGSFINFVQFLRWWFKRTIFLPFFLGYFLIHYTFMNILCKIFLFLYFYFFFWKMNKTVSTFWCRDV